MWLPTTLIRSSRCTQFNVERTQFEDRVEQARKEAYIAAKETLTTEMAILDKYNKALKNNIVERGTHGANARRVRVALMELRCASLHMPPLRRDSFQTSQ